MKNCTYIGLSAFAAAAMGTTAVSAAEVTLRFATTNPSFVHLNKQILHPWAKRINEQAKGVLKIDVRDGKAIANHLNYYDRVMSDVVQIAWGLQSVIPAKLPLSQGVALPFLYDKSEPASTAFWRLYDQGTFGKEYDDMQPLMLILFPQSGIQLRKETKAIGDLKGLKLTTSSRWVGEWIKLQGAAPISIVISEAYEALQRGTVDGIVTPFTAMQPFKFPEVTNYHIDAAVGGSGAHVFMTKKKFKSLPAKAREILSANSGEKQSRLFGAFWDRVQQSGRKMAAASGTVVEPPADVAARWRAQAEKVQEQWIKAVPGGAKVVKAFRTALAKEQAGK